MEISPGRCLIPWRIFSVLPVVRTIAPNAAAMVLLRQQLQAAGAITSQRLVDIAAAEPVITRMQPAAPRLQPKRQSAKPAAGKATSQRQRLASGYISPDNRHSHAHWS